MFYSNFENFDNLCYELCGVEKWEWLINRWLSNYKKKIVVIKSLTNTIYYIIEFEKIDLINLQGSIVKSIKLIENDIKLSLD